MSEILYSPDKPKDCKYCYWYYKRKGCTYGDPCYYEVKPKENESPCDDVLAKTDNAANQNYHHGVCASLFYCSFTFGGILRYSFRYAWPAGVDRTDILRSQCADSFCACASGQFHLSADDRSRSAVCSLLCPELSEIFISIELEL